MGSAENKIMSFDIRKQQQKTFTESRIKLEKAVIICKVLIPSSQVYPVLILSVLMTVGGTMFVDSHFFELFLHSKHSHNSCDFYNLF